MRYHPGMTVTFVEEYRTMDKTTWGYGPWMHEADKAVWVDETTGFDCMIHRNNMGALCGYVGVPKGHPAFEADYDSLDVGVHGGLTYGGLCQVSDDPSDGVCHIRQPDRPEVYWLGFDCGHFMDYMPGLASREELMGLSSGIWKNSHYRTVDYVIDEVQALALQLAALK